MSNEQCRAGLLNSSEPRLFWCGFCTVIIFQLWRDCCCWPPPRLTFSWRSAKEGPPGLEIMYLLNMKNDTFIGDALLIRSKEIALFHKHQPYAWKMPRHFLQTWRQCLIMKRHNNSWVWGMSWGRRWRRLLVNSLGQDSSRRCLFLLLVITICYTIQQPGFRAHICLLCIYLSMTLNGNLSGPTMDQIVTILEHEPARRRQEPATNKLFREEQC